MDDFFSQLKQRRAFRALAVYAVAAFAVWQAADIAIPALSLPQVWMRYIVAGALTGVPIVAVVSWLSESRVAAIPQQLRKRHGVRGRIGALVIGVAGLVLIVGMAYRLSSLTATQARPSISFELGIERYFSGDHRGALDALTQFLSDSSAPVERRQDAARYLVRSNDELGDTTAAKEAIRALMALEPPLAFMFPTVESDAVMKLYYQARQERLAAIPTATRMDTVGVVEVLDFVVLGQPPAGMPKEEWRRVGPGIKEVLLAELFQQSSNDIPFVDRSNAALQRQYDVYRFLASAESGRTIKPTHIVIGSLAARGDQVLVSAWLIDAQTGALLTAEQMFGTVETLAEVVAHVAVELKADVPTRK
jgi:TolB-like protein